MASSSSERAKLLAPTTRRRRCRCRLSSDDDIIMWEILPRVPVKTLCRFRCVSKSWYHLLSSDHPEFRRLHRRRSEQKPPTLLVITPHYAAIRIPFFTMKMDDGGERRVAGSAADLGFDMIWPLHDKVSACRGLVLVYNRRTMRVWNPATGERIDVEVPARRDYYLGHVLGQDLLGEDIVAAMGYVESTGEYKVLIFHTGTSCEALTIGGSRGWRATKGPPFCLFAHGGTCNVVAVVGKFVHALPVSPSDGIARFDLEKEEWSVIPGVAPCRLAPRYKYSDFLLGEVNGFLCLVQFSECRCRADIWLLKDYDEGIWVKEYTIDLSYDPYLRRGCERGYMVKPLTIEKDGRILFISTDLNLLFYYDPESESFQVIYKVDGKKFSFMSTLYTESFTSLKRGKIGYIGRCPAV